MTRNEQEDLKERLRRSALAAAGITGAMGATEGGLRYLRSADAEKAQRATKRYSDFLAQMQPGDVVFHRKGAKWTGNAELLGKDLPIKEGHVMLAGKGDPFYHASIYRGKGNITEAADWKQGVKNTRLSASNFPEELIAMRARENQVKQAIDRVEDIRKSGTPYRSDAGSIEHGLKHLAGLSEETGKTCNFTKRGIVCTELAAEAYPKVFKDRLASPGDMRFSDDLKFVARYNPTKEKITLGENLLAHGVYPMLKNAKWGLLGGLGVLGAGALGSMMNNKGD